MEKEIIKLDEVRHIITNNCNLQCLHCYLKASNENTKDDITNITEDVLENFYLKYKPNIVSATGGEPLLKKDMVKKIAKIINQYGGALEVVTNGILITENFVDELQNINPNTFYQISLDGLEDYHNYLRNNVNAFKLALNAISIIVKKGIKLKVRLTATDENLNDIPGLIELLDSYSSTNISLVIRPVVSAGRAKDNNLFFQKDYSILDTFKSKNIKIYTTDNEEKCGCGVNTIAIDSLGNIYPCNYTVGNPHYLMGNICNLDLSLFENEEFSNFNGKCYARHLQMFPNNKKKLIIKDNIIKKYDIKKEYINIDNYSPFSYINEVSSDYQKKSFLLPIIKINNNEVPVHPDTFHDLGLNPSDVIYTLKAFPTASYRTVYIPSKNIFIKLPLLRKITRGLRDLPNRQLDMCKEANHILKNTNIKGFYFLEETPVYGEKEIFNYIIREIKYPNIMPLFYIIKTKYFSKKIMFNLMKNMIDIWFQLVSNNLYLEFHTQNILVDDNLNIYYRDLSDIRSIGNKILAPSYQNLTIPEINSLFFDKTFCSQNLDHIFRYYTEFTDKEKELINKYINEKISEYGIEFPNYSIIFPLDSQNRVPIKTNLINYRI